MRRCGKLNPILYSFVFFALVYYVGVRHGSSHNGNERPELADPFVGNNTILNDRDDHLAWFMQVSTLVRERVIDFFDKNQRNQTKVPSKFLFIYLPLNVKISDLHISIFHNPDIVKDLEYFLKNMMTFLKPKLVIATGDLTDGKYDNMRSTTQFEEEWKIYSKLLSDNEVLEKTVWLDLRGNHGWSA